MFCIVGLGNPKEKYQHNRHNVGHMFVDYLKSSFDKTQDKQNFKAIKTDCFMNQSGIFVKKMVKNWNLEIENLIVIHDDLDIPLGKFKIQKGNGPQLHNGLESIESHLKTKDFLRVRIGVDARQPDRLPNGETYVLQDFLSSEKDLLDKDVFPKILSRLQSSILKIDNPVIV